VLEPVLDGFQGLNMSLGCLAKFMIRTGRAGLAGLEEGFHFRQGRLYEGADSQEMLVDGFDIPPESVVADVAVIKLDTIKENTSHDHS